MLSCAKNFEQEAVVGVLGRGYCTKLLIRHIYKSSTITYKIVFSNSAVDSFTIVSIPVLDLKTKKGISMASRLAFFVVASVLLIVKASSAPTASKHLEIQFSYSGETGPNKWASLDPKYSICSTGKSQSPIDIERQNLGLNKNLKPLTRVYNPINATLVKTIENIRLDFAENSGVLISDGKEYKLLQMHWHTPSEHTMNGLRYDAELHLVHEADDSSLSVVGVLYRLGRADPIIAKLQKKLYELAHMVSGVDEEAQISLGRFNMKQLKKRSRKYYKYNGSFTTPPCTEKVNWYILGKVRSISEEQIEALKAPMGIGYKNNSRPMQPLNGRNIQLYSELA